MGQAMPQPFKHPKTGVYYFRKVVPEPLRAAVGRREFRVSLGTKELREAKLRYPEAAATIGAILQRAQGGPAHLTHKQLLALAGEWYRRELARHENEPGDIDGLAAELGQLQDLHEDSLTPEYRQYEHDAAQGLAIGGPETATKYRNRRFLQAVAADVDGLLRAEGLLIDRDSYDRLAEEVFWNKVRLRNTLQQRAGGDYRPDGFLQRLPAWERRKADEAERPDGPRLTLQSLVDAWATERRPPERTLYEWRRVVDRLAAHLGHDDPERITKADIVAWKDALLAAGKAGKTVKNHVDVVHALYNSALENERLQRTDNPAKGVRVAAKQDPKERRLPYSDGDAAVILGAARKENGARRWVPWLLALTGARLDEVCQALVADVRRQDGIWYLDINEDGPGKSLKNRGSARKVPLHGALIAEGFVDYVRSLPSDGPLFPDLTPDRFDSRGGNGTKILGRWVRGLGITDLRKAPNHSWRHRFKDVCRAAGIEKTLHDALTGHASSDVGDRYGLGYPLAVLAAAVERIPVPNLTVPNEELPQADRRRSASMTTAGDGNPLQRRPGGGGG